MGSIPPQERQRRLIVGAVEQRLDQQPAWPANIFKLEFEGAGIYQDRTGGVLKELLNRDEVNKTYVEIADNQVPFFTRPGDPPPEPSDEITQHTENLLRFFSESSDFAELCAYTALCKIYDEIGSNITAMQVLPKGTRPHILNGTTNELDGLIQLHNEYIPIEVYNGGDYLSVRGYNNNYTEKYKQLREYSSEEEPESNPMLINRRGDSEFESRVRKEFNGMVVNTDLILGCEATHGDIAPTLRRFNLNGLVHLLPPLEISGDEELTGTDYDDAVTNDPALIRPPSKIAEAAEALPSQYLTQIRGGVQLFYVNTFYRRADSRTEREASLVLQAIYNLLLREGGMDRHVALDLGWDEFTDSYRHVKSAKDRKGMTLDQTREYISTLLNKGVLVERDGRIHARKATHPQPTFSF